MSKGALEWHLNRMAEKKKQSGLENIVLLSIPS